MGTLTIIILTSSFTRFIHLQVHSDLLRANVNFHYPESSICTFQSTECAIRKFRLKNVALFHVPDRTNCGDRSLAVQHHSLPVKLCTSDISLYTIRNKLWTVKTVLF